jgi:hypothetical protein
MQIIRFLSDPAKTPFAPTWDYVMGEALLDELDADFFNAVAKIILSKENTIIQETAEEYHEQNLKTYTNSNFDGYTGLGSNSLTSRSNLFNVLSWEENEIKIIKNKILEKYILFLNTLNVKRCKTYIQCWANVLRTGQHIETHLHSVDPLTYLGGHLTITENSTSTIYINPINQLNDPITHTSENQIGKITFFQNNIPHCTTPNLTNSPRITIAFDLMTEERFHQYSNDRKKHILLLDDYNE